MHWILIYAVLTDLTRQQIPVLYRKDELNALTANNLNEVQK